MPEGPSIVILKEAVQQFEGKKIISVSGNSTIAIERLNNKKIIKFKTWGKHFLICFDGFTVKIHLLMFGTYRINEQKNTTPRLSLVFRDGEINFYTCQVKILEGNTNDHYDWSADVMNEKWNPKKAQTKLKEIPNAQICDALLDQDIFSGVGNIIKNEVLYRTFVQPESKVGKISARTLTKIVNECSLYSFDFLKWKKALVLEQHWLAHTKKMCQRCDLSLVKKYTGVKKRRSFFCTNCQKLYI